MFFYIAKVCLNFFPVTMLNTGCLYEITTLVLKGLFWLWIATKFIKNRSKKLWQTEKLNGLTQQKDMVL